MKKDKFQKQKRLLQRLMFVCLSVLLLFPEAAPTKAAYDISKDSNTVRMGFFEFGKMLEGAEEGAPKSGYCYEYMMQVAAYTGWNYEFVYGSYAELYEMLKNREIDILPYTNYNEQRGKEVLFGDMVLGEEEYYIVVRNNNDSFYEGDLKALNGKTISTIEGADYNTLLLDFIEANNLDVNIMYCKSLETSWRALHYGTVDATIFTSNAYDDFGFKSIYTFGRKPNYIAVSKSRPDLLNQLNEATSLIKEEIPAYIGELSEKYLSDNPMHRILTREEQKWVNTHPVIRVGGFSNNPTDLNVSKGKATGFTVDLIDGIVEKLNLDVKVEYRCYDSLDEMQRALKVGEIDVFYPFYPSQYLAQDRGLIITKTVRIANMELVYKAGTTYEEALRKIASPTKRLGYFYINDNFPNAEIVPADSVADAINMVRKGEALGAIAYNESIHPIKEKYDDLNSTILLEGCGACFASTPENHAIVMTLNRGLKFFTNGEIAALASKNTSEHTVTTKAYLASHQEVVYLIIIIIITLGLLVFALTRMSYLKRKADEASLSKSTFLFNMSHDIRTPMNAITGFIDKAIRHKDNKPILDDSLEKAKTSSEYLLKIINDILDMARIESGKLELNEQLNYIEDGNKIVLEMFGAEAAKKGIDFRPNFDIANKYLWFDGDRTLQIIANLLSNAIKYTDAGGIILYSVKEEPCEREGYGKFVITVKDNGHGMTEEFLKKIYDAFERDQSAIRNGAQGTGLGMSIVKKLADAMGSKVDIQSEPGKGTTITVTSVHRIATGEEIAQFRDEHDDKHDYSQAVFPGKHVLIVEDNELNRDIARDILEEEQIIVEDADDGKTAVELMEKKGPDYFDLILMDIQMPIMNGYEATKAIRAMFPDKHIPIIALSANAFAEDVAASLEAGMDNHVAKPINLNELNKAMSEYL